MGAMPLPVANNNIFCVGKSYLNPSKFSAIGKPPPITCEIAIDEPGCADVSQSLNSVFLIRNSHCAGDGPLPAAASASSVTSPVGGEAMARKIGLAFSSTYDYYVMTCNGGDVYMSMELELVG